MISLQELFEEEANPSQTIDGLRFASSEFRHAFFKVRDVLLKCSVAKSTTSTTTTTITTTKEKEKETTHPVPEKTPIKVEKAIEEERPTMVEEKPVKVEETVNVEKPVKVEEKVEEKPVKNETGRNNNRPRILGKLKDSDILDFDSFIRDQYMENERWTTPAIDVLKIYQVKSGKSVINPSRVEKYEEYLLKRYGSSTELHLRPKYIKDEGVFDKTGLMFYRHPVFSYVWTRKDGKIFYVSPSGKVLKEIELLPYRSCVYVKLVGYGPRLSARALAMECYIHKETKQPVLVVNGNKTDLSYKNLATTSSKNYQTQSRSYDLSDVIKTCEYIKDHNKCIDTIEIDSGYTIGYSFAKQILDKKRYTEISDKYF